MLVKSARCILVVLALSWTLAACSDQEEHRKLSLGGGLNISMLAVVADQKGFFKSEGVDAGFQTLQNGKVALDAVSANKIDIGIVTDANVAVLAQAGLGDVRVLGSIMQKTDDALVGRRNALITDPASLKGKKLAYVPAGTSEVFLALFSKANGIDLAHDKPTPMTAQAMQAALTHGDVDAVSVWQPFRLNIMRALGDNGIEFTNNGVYRSEILLVARRQTLADKNADISKVIKALVAAQTYILTHKDDSITLLANTLGVDRDALEKSWSEYDFHVFADPALNQHLGEVTLALATIDAAQNTQSSHDFSAYIDQSLLDRNAPGPRS